LCSQYSVIYSDNVLLQPSAVSAANASYSCATGYVYVLPEENPEDPDRSPELTFGLPCWTSAFLHISPHLANLRNLVILHPITTYSLNPSIVSGKSQEIPSLLPRSPHSRTQYLKLSIKETLADPTQCRPKQMSNYTTSRTSSS
jgi:hypothetical protein